MSSSSNTGLETTFFPLVINERLEQIMPKVSKRHQTSSSIVRTWAWPDFEITVHSAQTLKHQGQGKADV